MTARGCLRTILLLFPQSEAPTLFKENVAGFHMILHIRGNPDEPANEKFSWMFKTSSLFEVDHHAEVTSKRTNLSPFTKDYRGAAS